MNLASFHGVSKLFSLFSHFSSLDIYWPNILMYKLACLLAFLCVLIPYIFNNMVGVLLNHLSHLMI